MATVLLDEHARVPDGTFEDFVASRPDEETWELVEGHVLMQAQPSVEHQLVAGNIERLLNDALERAGILRFAIQATTIDLRPGIEGSYVPDVSVLDATDDDLGRNTSRTCFLAAEIVSPSDMRTLPGTGEAKIATKVKRYRGLPSCEAILVVELEEQGVFLHVRRDAGWRLERLRAPDDTIVLPSFGLRCALRDIYARTSVPQARPNRIR